MGCRHCGHPRANRPRQLCCACYYKKDIRRCYQSLSIYGQRGVEDYYGQSPPAPMPTLARPGSPEKIAILEQRALVQQALWHPDDAEADDE